MNPPAGREPRRVTSFPLAWLIPLSVGAATAGIVVLDSLRPEMWEEEGSYWALSLIAAVLLGAILRRAALRIGLLLSAGQAIVILPVDRHDESFVLLPIGLAAYGLGFAFLARAGEWIRRWIENRLTRLGIPLTDRMAIRHDRPVDHEAQDRGGGGAFAVTYPAVGF